MKKYINMSIGIVALIIGITFYILDKLGIAPAALDDSGEILGTIGALYSAWKAETHDKHRSI